MNPSSMASVLGTVTSLLIQESDLLLGVEPYFEMIEYLLRKNSYFDKLRALIPSIEDAITELTLISDKKQKAYALLQYYIVFEGDRHRDLYFVMLVMLLLDYFELVEKLSEICNVLRIPSAYYRHASSFDPPYTSNMIISGAITQCEALVAEHRINPIVKRQAMWLRKKFNSFHRFLEDVEIDKLSQEQMAWIDEVFDVCCSATNVATFFLESHRRRQKKRAKKLLKNLIQRFSNSSQEKLAKQLAQIRDQVQDVADRKPQLISTPVLSRDSFRSLTLACAADQLDLVTFDEDVDAIIARLLVEDRRCITISILGISGVGKTSLAKLVYSNDAVVNHFPLRMWVSGTSEMEIVKNILGFGGSLDHDQVMKMANTVFADKRFLIVVDDSCAESRTEMGDLFRGLVNGSRMIFIVHKPEEAPPFSETNFNYRLHLRTDCESWALFMYTLKQNISPQLLKDLKKQILRTCGGLPKVIASLAGLLSKAEATFEEWSRVIEQLYHDEAPWLHIQEEINTYLPLHFRRCLFYFGLFPADYNIPARRLINLWVAEGLAVGQIYGMSAESVAEECLEELTNLDIVHVTERKLNGNIKTCSLPEALRLHWITKAKEANFFQGHGNIPHGTRRLADHVNPGDAIFQHIHSNKSTHLYPCYRNSVSFLSFDSRESAGKDIGNFLERCIAQNCFFFLLVLHLETVYRPELPKGLSKLSHLRYLGLRWTHLDSLPMFINKLLSLQTLDLKGTCIGTFPASIWKMEQLRHLFSDQSSRTIFLPPLQESFLEDLQTLWGLFIDERSPVKNGLDKLPFIIKLGLKSKVSMASQKYEMSSQLEAVKNWVMNLNRLQKLRLKSFDELEQPWDLHLDNLSNHSDLSSVYLVGILKNQQLVTKFPQYLIELTLSGSGVVDDPMLALEKLPNLEILRLYSKSYIGERMVCRSGGFPKLKMLKLWELEHLEEWDIEDGSLSQLKDLEIRRCMKLKMLPDGLKNIKTLRKVKLTRLPMVSQRVKDITGEDRIKIAHVLDVCIED